MYYGTTGKSHVIKEKNPLGDEKKNPVLRAKRFQKAVGRSAQFFYFLFFLFLHFVAKITRKSLKI